MGWRHAEIVHAQCHVDRLHEAQMHFMTRDWLYAAIILPLTLLHLGNAVLIGPLDFWGACLYQKWLTEACRQCRVLSQWVLRSKHGCHCTMHAARCRRRSAPWSFRRAMRRRCLVSWMDWRNTSRATAAWVMQQRRHINRCILIAIYLTDIASWQKHLHADWLQNNVLITKGKHFWYLGCEVYA